MTDENGSRVVRDVLIDEPNVKMMDTSESLRQYTTTDGNSGNEPCMITRYIEELSSSRSEVAKAQYAKVSYVGLPMGSQLGHGVKGWKLRNMFGFAKFDRDENARLVGYRLEMWYDGNCIAVHDTIRPGAIKRLQIPEDWHVSFKYPDKFKYSNPFSRKHVVRD